MVPRFALLGRSLLLQEAILGVPTIIESPWPMSSSTDELDAISVIITYIFLIGRTSQLVPFQHSRLLVSKLNPTVPVRALFGLPAVFQEGILFW